MPVMHYVNVKTLQKKTLALICSTACLIPNSVGAVQPELGRQKEREKKSEFYSILIQPCGHITLN